MTSELRIGMQVHTAPRLRDAFCDGIRLPDTPGKISWISVRPQRPEPRRGLDSCPAGSIDHYVGVRHESGTVGTYSAAELGVVSREVATTAHELTPMEQRLADVESELAKLRRIVASHHEQLRSLLPPEDPDDEPPAADVPQGERDPLELARGWRELAAEDQESLCQELRDRPLTPMAAHYCQATADALDAVEPLAAEVERLQGANQSLSHAARSHRAQTVRLARQLAELAGADPDGEHEPDGLIEAIEQQLANADHWRTLAEQRQSRLLVLYPGLCSVADLDPQAGAPDRHLIRAAQRRLGHLIAEVTRLTPWAQLAQQLREAVYQHDAGDAPAAAQDATTEPAEGDG